MRTWPLALLVAIALPRCKGSPDETPWCSLARPPAAPDAGVARTWWRDAKPIVDARCGRCHGAQGIAPFTLARPSDFASRIGEVRRSIEDGTMPPYLAAPCCTPTHSMTRAI